MMKFMPKSLSLRVVLYVFLTSLVILTLLGLLIFSQVAALTKSIQREDLLEQARKISSFIEYDWKGKFEVDMPRNYEEYYSGVTDSHQYAVLNASGKVLFSSPNFMQDRIKDTLNKEGKHYFSFETDKGKYFSGLKYDYLFEGRIYPIYVIEYEAEFSKFIASLEEDFLNNIILLGGPLLILQAFIVVMIFRSALRPVLRAAREASNIKYDNLSARLDESNVHAEILPLIQSVNNSLSRLEKKAEAQKFFIANAAHELRTPISILKARISSLSNEREVFMLNEDLRNINHLISQMLDISRLDLSDAGPKEEVSLNDIAKKACVDIGPLFIAHEKELSLEEVCYDQIIMGNEDTLFRAVLNLLENALKHTGPKLPVEVIVADKKIFVRDYGKPIPDEHKIKIFERFEKLPSSAGVRGSGLGLSIVKKAAELHGGTISVNTRDNGNDFILDFS